MRFWNLFAGRNTCAIFKQGRNYEHRDSGILLAYRGTCTIFNEAMTDAILEYFCRSQHLRDFQTGPQL